MLIDTSLKKVFQLQAHLACFRDMATSFVWLPSPPVCMWQQLLDHMALLERFLPWGLHEHAYPAVAPQELLVPHGGRPSHCGSTSRRFVDGSRRTCRCPVFLFRFLPCPCCCIPMHLSGWGAHLLDLTASGLWSTQESSMHIKVFKMKAVLLALAAFLPQLSGQSLVLMSDNASVVAYFWH